MITKEILKVEIEKTEETIKQLIKIQKEQDKKHKQLIKDCDAGIEINTFVLEKLKEEYKDTTAKK